MAKSIHGQRLLTGERKMNGSVGLNRGEMPVGVETPTVWLDSVRIEYRCMTTPDDAGSSVLAVHELRSSPG